MGGKNPIQAVSDAVSAVVVAPVSAAIEGTKKLASGDVTGAANTAVGTILNNNPVSLTVNASGDAGKEFLNTKEANNLTLGLSGDAVRATEAQNSAQRGETLNDEQMKDIGIYNAKAAAVVTAAAYVAPTVGTWAAANPVTAASTAALIAQGKGGSAITNVANNLAPGIGNLIDPILNPPAVRAPASSGSTGGVGNATDSYSVGALDSTSKIALLGAGVTVLLLIIKKLKR